MRPRYEQGGGEEMILQSLAKLYDDLEKQGKNPPLFYCEKKIDFAISIATDGSLIQIIDLDGALQDVPIPERHTSGKQPNFLCDTAEYLLGLDKSEEGSGKKLFEESKAFHKKILSGENDLFAKSILAEAFDDTEFLCQLADSLSTRRN